MKTRLIVILCVVAILTACTSNTPAPDLRPVPTETVPPVAASATPESTPAVAQEPNPFYKVAAFYYPWYGNPTVDGEWIHWTQNNHTPPEDIASDYYPVLGAYSSNDPAVVAQHMEWLQQAGIGVIISSWWGQGSKEDQAVPLLLQTAEKYGIKVAFHVEPYNGRTPESLVKDIRYLYRQYGNSAAFFRSTAASRYSLDKQLKGMFFVWSIESQAAGSDSYWREAMDQIHDLPEGGLVIANSVDAAWIEGSHFDGLYNYATLDLAENGGFDWARSLPPDTLYIPSVLPGFSARRVGYPDRTYVARRGGNTYNEQWAAALSTGIQPEMVTITSFNEWHEGNMIEPARAGAGDGVYADFEMLPPEGYLALTRDWISKYLTMSWSPTYQARIQIVTTSDWTTLEVISGGAWIRPQQISASILTTTGTEAGDRFVLMQSPADANAGKTVEMTWDVLWTGLIPGQEIILQLERGNIGKTQVTIYNLTRGTPVAVKTFEWAQVTTRRNSHQISIPSDLLLNASP